MKQYSLSIITATMLLVGQVHASDVKSSVAEDFPLQEMKEFRTVVSSLSTEVDNYVTKHNVKRAEVWLDQYTVLPYLHNISLYMDEGSKLYESVRKNFNTEDKMSPTPSAVAKSFFAQIELGQLAARTGLLDSCPKGLLREEYDTLYAKAESEANTEEKRVIESLSKIGSGLLKDTAIAMLDHSKIIDNLNGKSELSSAQRSILTKSYKGYGEGLETLKLLEVKGLQTQDELFKTLLATQLPIYAHIKQLTELSKKITAAMKR